MPFSLISALVFAGLSMSSPLIAARYPSTVNPSTKLGPHHFASIDLADYEGLSGLNGTSLSSELQKRTDVTVCDSTNPQGGSCANLGNNRYSPAYKIATLLYDSSKDNDCSTHTGSDQANGVQWSAYAADGICHTTAQLKTIYGAMNKYADHIGGSYCGVHCLRLVHGSGNWNAYVTISPSWINLGGYSCGPSESFGYCVKGGEKDAN